MAEPLRIRFATDTAGVKSGMQDLAASVVSNMVKVSGTIVANTEAAGAAAGKLGQAFGTGAQGVANAATTIAADAQKIGAAGLKAANDSGVSGVAIGAAMGKAASQTATASAVGQASMAALSAKASFTYSVIRNEVAQTASILAASPLVAGSAVAAAGILALVGTYMAVEAAAAAARERMESVLKVARGAEDAGVGTSFFQRWLGEAKSLNLEVAKLENMLKQARSAATEKIGEGDKGASSSAGDRIKQNVLAGNLGKDAETRFNAVGDQESKIRVVLDLLDELKAKGANLAAFDLAGKVFGEDFERKMRSGVDIIGQLRKAMDDVSATTGAGIRVLSPQEAETAERLKKTLEDTTRILADAMAPIQRDLVEYQAKQAQSAAEFNKSLAEAAASVLSLYNYFADVQKIINQIANSSFWAKISGLSDKLGLTSYRGMELVDPNTGKTIQQQPIAASGSAGAGAGAAGRVTPRPRDTSNSLPSLGGGKSKSASPSETQDRVESYIQSLERSTAALKAEVEAYGKSNEEKQKAIALARGEEIAKQRGTALTEEEIRKLTAVGAAAGAARDKMALLQQQSQQAAEAMRALGDAAVDSLYGMIAEGRTANDVMESLAKTLLKAALQASLMGTGPLAGLFGTAAAPGATGASSVGGLVGLGASLFKAFPGFADGGYTGSGGRNDPAGIVHAGEYVIPADVVRRIGVDGIETFMRLPGFAKGGLVGARGPALPSFAPAGGGGSFAIDLGGTTIDARGSNMSEGQMRAVLDQRDQALVRRLGPILRDLVDRGAFR